MRRRVAIVLVILATVSFAFWAAWPRLVVASLSFVETTGDEPSRAWCDRVVALGNRATPAIIAAMQKQSPWQRRAAYLPVTLKEIGGTAHDRLILAIDQQPEARKKARLTSSLILAFDDWSYLDTLLEDYRSQNVTRGDLGNLPEWCSGEFPDAPPMLLDNQKLNLAFVEYWQTNSEPDASPEPPSRAASSEAHD